jgi:hypothetical protein
MEFFALGHIILHINKKVTELQNGNEENRANPQRHIRLASSTLREVIVSTSSVM